MNVWLHAIRPKTLVAGAAPVFIGSTLAWADDKFTPWVALVALVCAVLIQIASNFINELEDFKRGADADRVGPLRAVSSGLITPNSMRMASWAVVLAAFCLGLFLVWHAGAIILLIGLFCLVAAWMYTGGPFPLAYHGLGEVFAFVFFGVVAVMGTYYVHTSTWTWDAFIASIGPGLLAANILAVNNIRDAATDRAVGKRTLAVRIGETWARFVYVLCSVVALVVPSVALNPDRGPFVFMPLVVLPVAILYAVLLYRRKGKELNTILAGTALMYVLYTVALCIGLSLSTIHRYGTTL